MAVIVCSISSRGATYAFAKIGRAWRSVDVASPGSAVAGDRISIHSANLVLRSVTDTTTCGSRAWDRISRNALAPSFGRIAGPLPAVAPPKSQPSQLMLIHLLEPA